MRAGLTTGTQVYADGYYHMTYTTSDHIEMVRSRTLKGLLVGAVRNVYSEPNSTRSAFMVRTLTTDQPLPARPLPHLPTQLPPSLGRESEREK